MTTTRRNDRSHPLVGRWFHSFAPSGVVQWQGQVLRRVSRDLFLVQLYEWFVGCASDEKLVRLADMVGWSFYDTNEQMNDAYEYRLKYRREKVETMP
jgi:hypothetical protein